MRPSALYQHMVINHQNQPSRPPQHAFHIHHNIHHLSSVLLIPANPVHCDQHAVINHQHQPLWPKPFQNYQNIDHLSSILLVPWHPVPGHQLTTLQSLHHSHLIFGRKNTASLSPGCWTKTIAQNRLSDKPLYKTTTQCMKWSQLNLWSPCHKTINIAQNGHYHKNGNQFYYDVWGREYASSYDN